MKRLNKILIAGTLCFSLGYIANDIVGELGVEFAGSAFAFPNYGTLHSGSARTRVGSPQTVTISQKSLKSAICKHFLNAKRELQYAEEKILELRNLDFDAFSALQDQIRSIAGKAFSRDDVNAGPKCKHGW